MSGSLTTYDEALRARLTEFFSEDPLPWQRRLWDVGSILSLQEVHESGMWESQRVLSSSAVNWQRNALHRDLGLDVGLGERELRSELTKILKSPIPDPSPQRRRLGELIGHVRFGYLDRWLVRLESAAEPPKVERLARVVAAHLMDLGFSQRFLTRWTLRLRVDAADAPEIVRRASELARSETIDFSVLVALKKVPGRDLATSLTSWRTNSQAIRWLTEHRFDTANVRGGGAFLLSIEARDAYAAAALAKDKIDRLVARSTFSRGRRGEIEPYPQVWVAGHDAPIDLIAPARGADVVSLTREGHLYRTMETSEEFDDALELAAAVNTGALGPAVAGAWAAIESLLTDPHDPRDEGKVAAADRLAAIIACSWPRAELTTLSYRYRSAGAADQLSTLLSQCTQNRARAAVMAEALSADGSLQFGQSRNLHADPAAAERMRRLVDQPGTTLREVRDRFSVTLRRLYRSRNILLHGGSTQGVALAASLRTAAPLVGAGLDRIVHAALTEGLRPLDLAARAENSLKLVGGETGLSVVDLLERPA